MQISLPQAERYLEPCRAHFLSGSLDPQTHTVPFHMALENATRSGLYVFRGGRIEKLCSVMEYLVLTGVIGSACVALGASRMPSAAFDEISQDVLLFAGLELTHPDLPFEKLEQQSVVDLVQLAYTLNQGVFRADMVRGLARARTDFQNLVNWLYWSRFESEVHKVSQIPSLVARFDEACSLMHKRARGRMPFEDECRHLLKVLEGSRAMFFTDQTVS